MAPDKGQGPDEPDAIVGQTLGLPVSERDGDWDDVDDSGEADLVHPAPSPNTRENERPAIKPIRPEDKR